MRLLVIGDVLLDHDILGRTEKTLPDGGAPVVAERGALDRAGGAGLAALLAAEEADVTLVTALAEDPPAALLRRLLGRAVTLRAAPRAGTTVEKTRVLAGGRAVLRLDRGRWDVPAGDGDGLLEPELDGVDGVLVSDYGGGLTGLPGLRAELERAARRLPVVWDPHPRGAAPVPGCALVTPNLSEIRTLAALVDPHPPTAAGTAAALARRWAVNGFAVTLGERGALLVDGHRTADGETVPGLLLAAPYPAAGDPCGAGDRFAATAAVRLAAGDGVEAATTAAVAAATAFVAAGGAVRYAASSPPDGLVPRQQDRAAGRPPRLSEPIERSNR